MNKAKKMIATLTLILAVTGTTAFAVNIIEFRGSLSTNVYGHSMSSSMLAVQRHRTTAERNGVYVQSSYATNAWTNANTKPDWKSTGSHNAYYHFS